MTNGFQTWSQRDFAVDGLIGVGGRSRVDMDHVDIDLDTRASEDVRFCTIDDIECAD